MKDMQISHRSHITKIIYAHRIQKQSKAVALIQKKYQQTNKD